jgi:hypothetical protein
MTNFAPESKVFLKSPGKIWLYFCRDQLFKKTLEIKEMAVFRARKKWWVLLKHSGKFGGNSL